MSPVSVSLEIVAYAGLTLNFPGSYVSPALWTATELSITVVIACLPSLRPLFARVIWAKTHRTKVRPQSSHMSLASSWIHGRGKDSHDGGFNKLPEASGGSWGWPNKVAVVVRGGAGAEGGEYEIGEPGYQPTAPLKGIMVKTEVVQTIHERFNYHDELF